MITIGIDTHKATLVASAIDGTGREVSAGTFQNEVRGHAALVTWATEPWPPPWFRGEEAQDTTTPEEPRGGETR